MNRRSDECMMREVDSKSGVIHRDDHGSYCLVRNGRRNLDFRHELLFFIFIRKCSLHQIIFLHYMELLLFTPICFLIELSIMTNDHWSRPHSMSQENLEYV